MDKDLKCITYQMGEQFAWCTNGWFEEWLGTTQCTYYTVELTIPACKELEN